MTATEPRRSGEPRLASIASWAVLTASFGLSASTWIALATMAGFTAEIRIHDVAARLAWLMPVAVDGYLVVALVLWMSPVPTVITSFARKNTYMAAAIGIAAQSAYHALLTWSLTSSTWRTVLAALVGSLPPAFAGLAVHMRALIRRESDPSTTSTNTNTVLIDRQPTNVSADLNPVPSSIDQPTPARTVPSPVQVADRITHPPATDRHETALVPGRSARTDRDRPTVRTASPAALVAPSTDTPVTAQAATQKAPASATTDQYARAAQVATQYRTEHATPITSGQLAVRLKVTSEQAVALLARIDQAHPSTSIRTVNGHPTGAPVTVSTLTVVPEPTSSGTAPYAEPSALTLATLARSIDLRDQAIARAARTDFPDWLRHVRAAAGCARPIRLSGTMQTVETGTGRVLSTVETAELPDGVIYKPCGNRRETVCPTCSARYKRDAYHVVRTGLLGGRGVPEHVATHPAVFPTFTAPSFGPVHTHVIRRHTCRDRRQCACRPEPCHARRDAAMCPHGRTVVCYARHAETDRILGTPLCLDCYDHDAQVVWNLQAGELWRRTTIAMTRYLRRLARTRGINPATIRLSFGKAAEMQRRAVVHFHAIARLDGADPDQPGVILPPPPGIDAVDLVDAVEHAVATVGFHTDPHPTRPDGWRIGWGEQTKTRIITVAGSGEVTDAMVAAYLAKYATKSTEVTGHVSGRLSDSTINVYADPDGTHTERLVDACWMLGTPRDWRRLRQWAHMFGFGGHFFTKSRTYSITFSLLRNNRVIFRRTQTAGPGSEAPAAEAPTTLVVNFLQFVGAGWHTSADAMLANTSAALAREHQTAAQHALTALAA